MELLLTDEFEAWFAALDEGWAEEVAIAIEVVDRLGPGCEAPGSSALLRWYEHPSLRARALRFADDDFASFVLDEWAGFREYVGKVLAQLQSERFFTRLTELGPKEVDLALRAVERIRYIAHPLRWVSKRRRAPDWATAPRDLRGEVRQVYFEVLEAVGFQVRDVPAHSLAVRELSRRRPAPGFRLLYGVDAARDRALFVVGEKLDRSFYGDGVRKAEAQWTAFLDGAVEGRLAAEWSAR